MTTSFGSTCKNEATLSAGAGAKKLPYPREACNTYSWSECWHFACTSNQQCGSVTPFLPFFFFEEKKSAAALRFFKFRTLIVHYVFTGPAANFTSLVLCYLSFHT